MNALLDSAGGFVKGGNDATQVEIRFQDAINAFGHRSPTRLTRDHIRDCGGNFYRVPAP